jgi:hypothetical protein
MNRKAQSRGIFMVILGGAIVISMLGYGFLYLMGQAEQATAQSLVPVTYNHTYYAALDQTTQLNTITSNMNNQFTQANGTGTNVGDIINVVTTGGYNTLKIVGAMPNTFTLYMNLVASQLGIPVGFVILATMIVIVALLSLFILLVFRVYVS